MCEWTGQGEIKRYLYTRTDRTSENASDGVYCPFTVGLLYHHESAVCTGFLSEGFEVNGETDLELNSVFTRKPSAIRFKPAEATADQILLS